MKTLQDFLNEGVDIYPDSVDEATRSIIQDWFGYRQVGSDKFFPIWMKRTLDRDYPRYMELLRIEARTGGSEYDWLVTNYEERQVKLSGRDTNTSSATGTSNRTANKTFLAGQTETTRDTGSGTTSANGTSTDTGTSTTVRTPNLTNETNASGNDTSRHGVLQRQAPYSADYDTLTSNTNASKSHTVGEDGVDSGTASGTNDSGFNAGFPDLTIKNPTASSDELTDNANVSYNKTSQTGNEQVVTTPNTLNTTSNTGSDSHDNTVIRTHGGTDQDNTTETGSTSNNGTTYTDYGRIEREIHTGRSGQSPQYLLADAVKYIKDTSAWKWLYNQLDKNFLMVYNIDEY